jgi:hypothetical protein
MARVAQAPPPGVVRNATPEATPGKWYDANLVRFRGGQRCSRTSRATC